MILIQKHTKLLERFIFHGIECYHLECDRIENISKCVVLMKEFVSPNNMSLYIVYFEIRKKKMFKIMT